MDPGQAAPDFQRVAGDIVPAASLWGYAPLAIAVGLMPFAIEGFEAIIAGARRRTTLRTSALRLLIAWLHPWRGETLVAVCAGLALLVWDDRRRNATGPDTAYRRRGAGPRSPSWDRRQRGAMLAVCAATTAPIVYYFLLSRLDPGWRTSEQASVGAARIPWPVLVTCIAPIALGLAAATRRANADERLRPLLLWGLCCVVTVGLSFSGRYHALDGVAAPLGVLAVAVWPPCRGLWRRLLASTCVLLALAPTAVYAVRSLSRLQGSPVTQYTELNRSDVRAAVLAARHARGGMLLAPVALGTAIPALTDAASLGRASNLDARSSVSRGGRQAPVLRRAGDQSGARIREPDGRSGDCRALCVRRTDRIRTRRTGLPSAACRLRTDIRPMSCHRGRPGTVQAVLDALNSPRQEAD